MVNNEPAEVETPYEMGKRLFLEGMQEFCSGGYFEAHDLWEEFWQELRGPDRVFVQALIHLAVGTYHFENGNMNGARSQLSKAAMKLSKYPGGHWGVTTDEWLIWIGNVLANREGAHPASGLKFDVKLFPAHLPMAPR
jgi:predicted metal-dependent hydrolase